VGWHFVLFLGQSLGVGVESLGNQLETREDSSNYLRVLRARPFPAFSSIHSPNLDFGKQAVLKHPDLLHTDEFQQGQECDRYLGPTRRVLEKIVK
jgi:hypothetical protein